eukprot:scaffold117601_cov57-Phaeocystis_antarctica.AAC.5
MDRAGARARARAGARVHLVLWAQLIKGLEEGGSARARHVLLGLGSGSGLGNVVAASELAHRGLGRRVRVRARARVGLRVRACLREVAADARVDFEEGGSTVGPHLVQL